MVRPSQLTPMQRLLLAISLPITLVFLYFLFRKNDDEDDEEADAQVVTSRQTIIEVKVPHDAVGAVIGVQGAQIKMIRNVTKARLNFKDKDTDTTKDRILVIQGTQEGAQKAELMVRQIIVDQPQVVTEVIHVPNAAVGRIIGRSGETIRSISHQSKARVAVERMEQRDLGEVTQIVLKGTPLAVETAKMLISEKVEDQKTHQKESSEKLKRTNKAETKDKIRMQTEGDGSFTEVYVSAVEHPGHFWVQFLDRNALRLSQLVDEMTMFYGSFSETHNEDFEPVAGDIVAAPFSEDNTWYRAQIVGVLGDEVDLYFVDYGDSLVISKERIRRLRADFRELPFQAKECSLANVEPCTGDVWPEEAIVAFEGLVHVAQWKAMMSRNVDLTTTAVPSLQLIDTNGEKDVDVAEELVRRGLAVRTSSRTRSSLLPSADKVTASEDFGSHFGATRLQLTELDHRSASGSHRSADELSREQRDQLFVHADILHEPRGSSVSLADRCIGMETSSTTLSTTTLDTGYFSADLNHLPSYVSGPYEGVCDHMNGNSYYNDDDDDNTGAAEEAVVSVHKNLSLGFSPDDQLNWERESNTMPVVEASRLEVSLSDHFKGIELLEKPEVGSGAKIEVLEYAKIPLLSDATCETDLRSAEARDSCLMLQLDEALDAGSSASHVMHDLIPVVPETHIHMPLQEEVGVPSTELNFFPSSEASELLAETNVHSADGTEMDAGRESLSTSAEIPAGNTVDVWPLQSLEAALTDIPTEVSNSVAALAGCSEVVSDSLVHLSESYPSIKNSLHLSKLRTDLNLSSSEAVEAHQSCLTEGRPVALKQLALVNVANKYLTIRESLELSKHSVELDANLTERNQGVETDATLTETKQVVETDATLTETKQVVETDVTLTEPKQVVETDATLTKTKQVVETDATLTKTKQVVETDATPTETKQVVETDATLAETEQDEMFSSLPEAISKTDTSRRQRFENLSKSYPSVHNSLLLSDQRKVLSQELQSDHLDNSEAAVIHSKLCVEYPSVKECLALSGSKPEIFPETGNLVETPQQQKFVMEKVGSLTAVPVKMSEDDIEVMKSYPDLGSFMSIHRNKNAKLDTDQILQNTEEVLKSPTEYAYHEIVEIQRGSVLTTMPESRDGSGSHQSENESIVSHKVESEIEQQPIVTQREPEIEQQPIVTQREPEIEQQPLVTQREPEIEQQPIVTQRKPEIEQQSIVTQREPEIEQQPIVTQREPEIEQQSIVTQREPEIEQQPIVTQREPEIEQQPIVTQREPEIEQQSIVTQREPEMEQQSIVTQREPEIEQQPIITQREPEIEQQPIVTQREPEIEQQPNVTRREPEIELDSFVIPKDPETELEKVILTKPIERNDLSLNLKQFYQCEIDNVNHYFPTFCRLSDFDSGNINLKPPITCRPEWSTDDFDGLVSYIKGVEDKQQTVKHIPTKPADHHKKHDHTSKQEPVKLHEHKTKEGKAVVLPPNLAAQAFKAGLLDLNSATVEEVDEDHSVSRSKESDDGGFVVVESRKRRRLRSRCSNEREPSEETTEALSSVEHQQSPTAQDHYEAVLAKDALDQQYEAATLPMEATLQLEELSLGNQSALSLYKDFETEVPQSQKSGTGVECELQCTEVTAKEEEVSIPDAELQKFTGKLTEMDVQSQDIAVVQELAGELNGAIPFKTEVEPFSRLREDKQTLEHQETLSILSATMVQEAISLQSESEVLPDDSLPIQESETDLLETKPVENETRSDAFETVPALRILAAESLDMILVQQKINEPQMDEEAFIESVGIVPNEHQEVMTVQKESTELCEAAAEKELSTEVLSILSVPEGKVFSEEVLKAETSEREWAMEKNLAPFQQQSKTDAQQISPSINNETYMSDSQKLIYFQTHEKLGDFEAGDLQLEPQTKCRPEWATNDFDALVSYIAGDQASEHPDTHRSPGETLDHAKKHGHSKLHDSSKPHESAHKENKSVALPPNLAATVFKQHQLEFELDFEKDLPKLEEEVGDDGFKVVESRKRRRVHSRSSVENVDSEGDQMEQSSEGHEDFKRITQEICETEPQGEQEVAIVVKECDINSVISELQTREEDKHESNLSYDKRETTEPETVLNSTELGVEILPFAVTQKETELKKQKPDVIETLQEIPSTLSQVSASSDEHQHPAKDNQILSGFSQTETRVSLDESHQLETDNLFCHFPALCRLNDYESGKIQFKPPAKYRPEWETNDVDSLVSYIDGGHKRQQQLHSHPKSPERAKPHQRSKAHGHSKAHEPAAEGSRSITLPPNLAAKAFKAGLLDIDTDLDREECASEEDDSFTVVESRKHKRQRNRHSLEREEFEEGNQEVALAEHQESLHAQEHDDALLLQDETVLSGNEPEVKPEETVKPVITEHETREAVLSGNEPEVKPEETVNLVITEHETREAVLSGNEPEVKPVETVNLVITEHETHEAVLSGNEPEVKPEETVEPVITEHETREAVLSGNEPEVKPEETVEPVITEHETREAVVFGNEPEVKPEKTVEPFITEHETREVVLFGNEPEVKPEETVESVITEHKTREAVLFCNEPEVKPEETVKPVITEHETREAVLSGNEPEVKREETVEPVITEHETREAVLSSYEPEVKPEETVEPVITEHETREAVLFGTEPEVKPEETVEPVITEHETRKAVLSGNEPEVKPEETVEPVITEHETREAVVFGNEPEVKPEETVKPVITKHETREAVIFGNEPEVKPEETVEPVITEHETREAVLFGNEPEVKPEETVEPVITEYKTREAVLSDYEPEVKPEQAVEPVAVECETESVELAFGESNYDCQYSFASVEEHTTKQLEHSLSTNEGDGNIQVDVTDNQPVLPQAKELSPSQKESKTGQKEVMDGDSVLDVVREKVVISKETNEQQKPAVGIFEVLDEKDSCDLQKLTTVPEPDGQKFVIREGQRDISELELAVVHFPALCKLKDYDMGIVKLQPSPAKYRPEWATDDVDSLVSYIEGDDKELPESHLHAKSQEHTKPHQHSRAHGHSRSQEPATVHEPATASSKIVTLPPNLAAAAFKLRAIDIDADLDKEECVDVEGEMDDSFTVVESRKHRRQRNRHSVEKEECEERNREETFEEHGELLHAQEHYEHHQAKALGWEELGVKDQSMVENRKEYATVLTDNASDVDLDEIICKKVIEVEQQVPNVIPEHLTEQKLLHTVSLSEQQESLLKVAQSEQHEITNAETVEPTELIACHQECDIAGVQLLPLESISDLHKQQEPTVNMKESVNEVETHVGQKETTGNLIAENQSDLDTVSHHYAALCKLSGYESVGKKGLKDEIDLNEESLDAKREVKVGLKKEEPVVSKVELHFGPEEPVVSQEELHFGSEEPVVSQKELHFGPEEPVVSQEELHFGPEEPVVSQEELHFGSEEPVVSQEELHFGPEEPVVSQEELHSGPEEPVASQEELHFGSEEPVVRQEELHFGPEEPAVSRKKKAVEERAEMENSKELFHSHELVTGHEITYQTEVGVDHVELLCNQRKPHILTLEQGLILEAAGSPKQDFGEIDHVELIGDLEKSQCMLLEKDDCLRETEIDKQESAEADLVDKTVSQKKPHFLAIEHKVCLQESQITDQSIPKKENHTEHLETDTNPSVNVSTVIYCQSDSDKVIHHFAALNSLNDYESGKIQVKAPVKYRSEWKTNDVDSLVSFIEGEHKEHLEGHVHPKSHEHTKSHQHSKTHGHSKVHESSKAHESAIESNKIVALPPNLAARAFKAGLLDVDTDLGREECASEEDDSFTVVESRKHKRQRNRHSLEREEFEEGNQEVALAEHQESLHVQEHNETLLAKSDNWGETEIEDQQPLVHRIGSTMVDMQPAITANEPEMDLASPKPVDYEVVKLQKVCPQTVVSQKEPEIQQEGFTVNQSNPEPEYQEPIVVQNEIEVIEKDRIVRDACVQLPEHHAQQETHTNEQYDQKLSQLESDVELRAIFSGQRFTDDNLEERHKLKETEFENIVCQETVNTELEEFNINENDAEVEKHIQLEEKHEIELDQADFHKEQDTEHGTKTVVDEQQQSRGLTEPATEVLQEIVFGEKDDILNKIEEAILDENDQEIEVIEEVIADENDQEIEVIEELTIDEADQEIEVIQEAVDERKSEIDLIHQLIASEKERAVKVTEEVYVDESEGIAILKEPVVSETKSGIDFEAEPDTSPEELELVGRSTISDFSKEPDLDLTKPDNEVKGELDLSRKELGGSLSSNLSKVYYSDVDSVSHHFHALCTLNDYESGNIQFKPPVKFRSEWNTNDVDSLVSFIEGDHKEHLEGHVHPKSREQTKLHQHSKTHGHSKVHEPSKAHESAIESNKIVALPPNLAARAFKAGLLDIDTDLGREECASEEDDSFTVVESRKHKRQQNRHSLEREEFGEGNQEVALLEHQESLHYDDTVGNRIEHEAATEAVREHVYVNTGENRSEQEAVAEAVIKRVDADTVEKRSQQEAVTEAVAERVDVDTVENRSEPEAVTEHVNVDAVENRSEQEAVIEAVTEHVYVDTVENRSEQEAVTEAVTEHVYVDTVENRSEQEAVIEAVTEHVCVDTVENRSEQEAVIEAVTEHVYVDTVENRSEQEAVTEAVTEHVYVDTVENRSEQEAVTERVDVDIVENRSEQEAVTETVREHVYVDSVENRNEQEAVTKAITERVDVDTVKNKSEQEAVTEAVTERVVVDTVENRSEQEAITEAVTEHVNVDTVEDKSEKIAVTEAVTEAVSERVDVDTVKDKSEQEAVTEAVAEEITEHVVVDTVENRSEQEAVTENVDVDTVKDKSEQEAVTEAVSERVDVDTVKDKSEQEAVTERVDVNTVKDKSEQEAVTEAVREHIYVDSVENRREQEAVTEDVDVDTVLATEQSHAEYHAEFQKHVISQMDLGETPVCKKETEVESFGKSAEVFQKHFESDTALSYFEPSEPLAEQQQQVFVTESVIMTELAESGDKLEDFLAKTDVLIQDGKVEFTDQMVDLNVLTSSTDRVIEQLPKIAKNTIVINEEVRVSHSLSARVEHDFESVNGTIEKEIPVVVDDDCTIGEESEVVEVSRWMELSTKGSEGVDVQRLESFMSLASECQPLVDKEVEESFEHDESLNVTERMAEADNGLEIANLVTPFDLWRNEKVTERDTWVHDVEKSGTTAWLENVARDAGEPIRASKAVLTEKHSNVDVQVTDNAALEADIVIAAAQTDEQSTVHDLERPQMEELFSAQQYDHGLHEEAADASLDVCIIPSSDVDNKATEVGRISLANKEHDDIALPLDKLAVEHLKDSVNLEACTGFELSQKSWELERSWDQGFFVERGDETTVQPALCTSDTLLLREYAGHTWSTSTDTAINQSPPIHGAVDSQPPMFLSPSTTTEFSISGSKNAILIDEPNPAAIVGSGKCKKRKKQNKSETNKEDSTSTDEAFRSSSIKDSVDEQPHGLLRVQKIFTETSEKSASVESASSAQMDELVPDGEENVPNSSHVSEDSTSGLKGLKDLFIAETKPAEVVSSGKSKKKKKQNKSEKTKEDSKGTDVGFRSSSMKEPLEEQPHDLRVKQIFMEASEKSASSAQMDELIPDDKENVPDSSHVSEDLTIGSKKEVLDATSTPVVVSSSKNKNKKKKKQNKLEKTKEDSKSTDEEFRSGNMKGPLEEQPHDHLKVQQIFMETSEKSASVESASSAQNDKFVPDDKENVPDSSHVLEDSTSGLKDIFIAETKPAVVVNIDKSKKKKKQNKPQKAKEDSKSTEERFASSSMREPLKEQPQDLLKVKQIFMETGEKSVSMESVSSAQMNELVPDDKENVPNSSHVLEDSTSGLNDMFIDETKPAEVVSIGKSKKKKKQNKLEKVKEDSKGTDVGFRSSSMKEPLKEQPCDLVRVQQILMETSEKSVFMESASSAQMDELVPGDKENVPNSSHVSEDSTSGSKEIFIGGAKPAEVVNSGKSKKRKKQNKSEKSKEDSKGTKEEFRSSSMKETLKEQPHDLLRDKQIFMETSEKSASSAQMDELVPDEKENVPDSSHVSENSTIGSKKEVIDATSPPVVVSSGKNKNKKKKKQNKLENTIEGSKDTDEKFRSGSMKEPLEEQPHSLLRVQQIFMETSEKSASLESASSAQMDELVPVDKENVPDSCHVSQNSKKKKNKKKKKASSEVQEIRGEGTKEVEVVAPEYSLLVSSGKTTSEVNEPCPEGELVGETNALEASSPVISPMTPKLPQENRQISGSASCVPDRFQQHTGAGRPRKKNKKTSMSSETPSPNSVEKKIVDLTLSHPEVSDQSCRDKAVCTKGFVEAEEMTPATWGMMAMDVSSDSSHLTKRERRKRKNDVKCRYENTGVQIEPNVEMKQSVVGTTSFGSTVFVESKQAEASVKDAVVEGGNELEQWVTTTNLKLTMGEEKLNSQVSEKKFDLHACETSELHMTNKDLSEQVEIGDELYDSGDEHVTLQTRMSSEEFQKESSVESSNGRLRSSEESKRARRRRKRQRRRLKDRGLLFSGDLLTPNTPGCENSAFETAQSVVRPVWPGMSSTHYGSAAFNIDEASKTSVAIRGKKRRKKTKSSVQKAADSDREQSVQRSEMPDMETGAVPCEGESYSASNNRHEFNTRKRFTCSGESNKEKKRAKAPLAQNIGATVAAEVGVNSDQLQTVGQVKHAIEFPVISESVVSAKKLQTGSELPILSEKTDEMSEFYRLSGQQKSKGKPRKHAEPGDLTEKMQTETATIHPEYVLPLESWNASKGQLLMEDCKTSGSDINLCSVSPRLPGMVPEAEDKKKKKNKKKTSVEAPSTCPHEVSKTTANQDVPVSSSLVDDTKHPNKYGKPSKNALKKTENIPSLAHGLLNATDGDKEGSERKKAKVVTPAAKEQQVVTGRHACSSEDSKSFEGNATKVDVCAHQDGRPFQTPIFPLTSLEAMGSSVANTEFSVASSCPSATVGLIQTEPEELSEKLRSSEQTRTRGSTKKVRGQDVDKATESSKKTEQHGHSIEETKTMIAFSTTTASCAKKQPIAAYATHDFNETLLAAEHRNAAILQPTKPSLSQTDENIRLSKQDFAEQGSWENYESRSVFSQHFDLDRTSMAVFSCDKSLRNQELRREMESPDHDFELLPSAADLRAESGASTQELEGVGASSIQQSKVLFHDPNVTHQETEILSKSWQTVQRPPALHVTPSSSSSADAEVEQILQGQPVPDVTVSDVGASKKFTGADLMTDSDLEQGADVVVTVTEVLDLEFIEETEVVTVFESVSDPGPPPSETWAFGRPKMSTRISPVAGKHSGDSEDRKFLTSILSSGAKDWTQTQPDVAAVADTAAGGGPLSSETSIDLEKRNEEKNARSAVSSTNVFTLSTAALSDIPVDPVDVLPLAFDGSSKSSHSLDLSLSSDASFQAITDRFVLTKEESSLMTDSCRRLFDQTTGDAGSSRRDDSGYEACQFWVSGEGEAALASTWPSVMYSFDKPDTSDGNTCDVKGTYSTPKTSSDVDVGPDRVSAESSGTNLDSYDDSLEEELTLKVAEFQSDEGSGGDFPVAIGGQPKASVMSGETWDSLSNDSLEGAAGNAATTAAGSQPESSLGNLSEDSLMDVQPGPSSVGSQQEHFLRASARHGASDSDGVNKEQQESDLGINIDPVETTECSDPKHANDGSSKKAKRKKKLVRKVQQAGASSEQESDEDGGTKTGL